MKKFILKRILLLIPTLFGVITITFFMMAFSPGDPAIVMLGERASKENVEKLRKDLGLDKPKIVQYGIYLSKIIKLDFGNSIKTGQKVINEIFARFPATIELALCAIIFASLLGIIAGIISAVKQYSMFDYISMIGALIGVSMPIFWLGLVLIILFSVSLNILPTGGRIDIKFYFTPITNFYIIDSIIYIVKKGDIKILWSVITHLILPAITLSTIPLSIIARITRSSMLEVLKQDYIKTARAKGINEFKVITKHALRNAFLPIVTVIGIQFGMLLGGAVLTETIFAWPGLGKWLYNAIEARDFPAVQGGVIIISTVFVLINLSMDILYTIINPKIKFE